MESIEWIRNSKFCFGTVSLSPDEARDDQGSIILPEGQVKTGRLEKGDFRLYKAMVQEGRTQFRLEIKRDGHAQLLLHFLL